MLIDNFPALYERRAEVYHSLAESLAGLPSWMLLPVEEWPLTKAIDSLAAYSKTAETTLKALDGIPMESEVVRLGRYRRLFGGPGRPRFPLYESMWRTGRFLGPEMVALEQLYKLLGLQVVDAEASDHASIELAFLAHLTQSQTADLALASKWKQLERLFIKKHAGQWLPALGRSLAASGDEVYGPIGELMADWIFEAQQSRRRQRKPKKSFHWPTISHEALCSLCGFCVQVCPSGVLEIQETTQKTMLRVAASTCNGCRKCVTACPSGVLNIHACDNEYEMPDEPTILLSSLRVLCPGCGQATVSQAELKFVAEQLGQQDWLPYCLPCRSELREELR
ncbi:MAG: molecular chaperone TorD family protein [Candidatus Promineifilaceae bacterium]